MRNARGGETNAGWRYQSRSVRRPAVWEGQGFTDNLEEDGLGLFVDPSQVRLVPRANDPYIWRYPPHVQKLFKRNMSDQTVGVYKALYREVEVKKSVNAVARDASTELGEWETGGVEETVRTRISESHAFTASSLRSTGLMFVRVRRCSLSQSRATTS
jgi:hypothetical protein